MNAVEAPSATRESHVPDSLGPIPVLLMVRELGLGGIERDVAKLAIGIDRSRFVPYVATYEPYGPRHDELRRAEISILHLDFPSLLSASALSAAAQFASFIRNRGIKIVHAFDPSSVFGVPLARLLRVPVVLSSQLGHRELHDTRTRKQLRWVDRLSDVVVVNCQALKRHLSSEHAVPDEKIELCYNGVDTREFYPGSSTRPPELSGADFVIGTVCVLRPEKRLDLLQAAFARVRGILPESKLVIVGSGPELQRLKDNAKNLKIEEHSLFVPALASVAPWLRAMDIFVSCSESEAFSNAILEAMACGCPVIGSRVGGTPELLGESGERGLLFTSGSIDELAEQLAVLMKNASLRRTLAMAGSDFAGKTLSIETNVRRTMHIYETLLRRKGLLH